VKAFSVDPPLFFCRDSPFNHARALGSIWNRLVLNLLAGALLVGFCFSPVLIACSPVTIPYRFNDRPSLITSHGLLVLACCFARRHAAVRAPLQPAISQRVRNPIREFSRVLPPCFCCRRTHFLSLLILSQENPLSLIPGRAFIDLFFPSP